MAEAIYHPLSGDLSGNVNQQEYFLQGSILGTSLPKLHDRLRGICDNVKPAPFMDIERTYVANNSNTNVPMMLKARKPADDKSKAPWQVTYLSNTEVASHTKPTMIRSNVTMAVSQDPTTWIEELGFGLQFETTLKGYFYRKGRIKIIVTQLVVEDNQTNKSNIDAAKLAEIAKSCLIEISVLSSASDNVAGDEVKHFAQLLAPIVIMEKLDHRRLQMQQ